jgi:hypothetical protein
MKHILLILSIAVGFALQGCGSVVLSTVAALNAQSPLTADPAGIEIAVDMPEGADIPQGGATFVISMARTDTGEALNETFALQRREASDGRLLFRVNPAELDDLRDIQARALAWETENSAASSGSFSVNVFACKIGDGPEDDARFSVAIRTEVGGGFMPLIRNALVMDAIEAADSVEDAPNSPNCE